LDRDYREIAKKYMLPVDKELRNTNVDFPIEEARLRNIWYPLMTAAAATAGYGWSLRHEVVSLVLTFLMMLLNKDLAYRCSFTSPMSPWECAPSLFHGIKSATNS